MLAKEGRSIVILLTIAMLLAHLIVGAVVWPVWGIVVVVIYLYRDPERTIPSAPLGIVSPVDGRIKKIQNQLDPFLKREAICISVQMNWYGVFVLRALTEGKIMQHWVHESTKQHDVEFDGPLQHAIWIQTDEQDDVVLAIHAGGRFRNMHCYAATGERIGQGKRCGFIPFGTRIDILLPTKTRTRLSEGQRVMAGCDIIAEFVH
jgi:phosphatidylserine decarboxylase